MDWGISSAERKQFQSQHTTKQSYPQSTKLIL
jgi:hypothetical protein